MGTKTESGVVLKKGVEGINSFLNSFHQNNTRFCLCAHSISISTHVWLQGTIPIAAVFDDNQDMKHEWAFKHSVQMINQNPNILPGRQLLPQVIRVPAGNRFELLFEQINIIS